MENDSKIDFIRSCVPTKIEQIEAGEPGSPGKLRVTGKYNDGTEYTNEFNTVLFAVGRTADTDGLNLPSAGVKTGSSKKIVADEADCSNVSNIFAIGDVLENRPELTPMAIQAGKLLGRRIAGSGKMLTDYNLVPTTVFTPIEYGVCGYSEEEAVEKFGEDSIEVYHSGIWPLEWTVARKYSEIIFKIQRTPSFSTSCFIYPRQGHRRDCGSNISKGQLISKGLFKFSFAPKMNEILLYFCPRP